MRRSNSSINSQVPVTMSLSRWSVVGLTVGLIISLLAASYGARERQGQEKRPIKSTLPKVISKVKNLEVVNWMIQKEGEPDAFAVIEIRNNSNKAVIALALESGDDDDAYGINRNGFNEDLPPVTVLEPHGTIVLEMELANLSPDVPLRVAGVIYADGTEDGDLATLGTMHRQRDHEKAKAHKKNGDQSQ